MTKNAIFDARNGMRTVSIFIIMLILLLPACSHRSGSTASVVKPKYHHRWYDRKKDKRTGRTRTVRMKG